MRSITRFFRGRKYLGFIGGIFVGAILTPILTAASEDLYRRITNSERKTVRTSICSTLVQGERRLVIAPSNDVVDTNMRFPNRAYVAFENTGDQPITGANFVVALLQVEPGKDRRPEVFALQASGSSIGLAAGFRAPTFDSSENLITLSADTFNPSEIVLIELDLLNPTGIYTEMRNPGLTHIQETEPGCSTSRVLNQLARRGTTLFLGSSYLNDNYCRPSDEGAVSCEFSSTGDTFLLNPGDKILEEWEWDEESDPFE